MDPNNLDKDQSTPTPEPQSAVPTTNVVGDMPAPVSPLQAITETEKETETPVETEAPQPAPMSAPQTMAPVEKKRSKTTMYLLILLVVLVVVAAGLFVYTLL